MARPTIQLMPWTLAHGSGEPFETVLTNAQVRGTSLLPLSTWALCMLGVGAAHRTNTAMTYGGLTDHEPNRILSTQRKWWQAEVSLLRGLDRP